MCMLQSSLKPSRVRYVNRYTRVARDFSTFKKKLQIQIQNLRSSETKSTKLLYYEKMVF